MDLDTANMCSHLKRKLFEEDGPYHKIWLALQEDDERVAKERGLCPGCTVTLMDSNDRGFSATCIRTV